jgi:hypothetical protein
LIRPKVFFIVLKDIGKLVEIVDVKGKLYLWTCP